MCYHWRKHLLKKVMRISFLPSTEWVWGLELRLVANNFPPCADSTWKQFTVLSPWLFCGGHRS